ncbi:MAG: hypothetical protein IIY28_04955 [Lachnospiraceae bacterium]|nr:hypothetical protein [Lachnospiraceae bacterium]
MKREEQLIEMTELANFILGAINGCAEIPICYVRRYNALHKAVFGGEDPEIVEAQDGAV